MSAGTVARIRFQVPTGLHADRPPEARGVPRDGVRLLVAHDGTVSHATFRDLGRYLRPGDLLVVNTSATLPAAVDGRRADGRPVVVHVAGPAGHGGGPDRVVELRWPDRSGPMRDGNRGERVVLAGGATIVLREPVTEGGRLWRATTEVPGGMRRYLERYGRPISYGYVHGTHPLDAYQTVFAREPGSAEMPSAGRPFSVELVTSLVSSGVAMAPIVLHTGVSSLEPGEAPQPEAYRVPAPTAHQVNLTRAGGGRVIAVGTTVVRALETVADPDGRVRPGQGWTDLVLGPDRPARAVHGLITGLHEPEASHLQLLVAVAGVDQVQRVYDAAVAERYRWHEFGDACLLLPPVDRRPAGAPPSRSVM